MTSSSSGYITMGRNRSEKYECDSWGCGFRLPIRHDVLLFSFKPFVPQRLHVTLHRCNQNKDCFQIPPGHSFKNTEVWNSFYDSDEYATMYNLNDSIFLVGVLGSSCIEKLPCFQFFFSFFTESQRPRKLPSGLWNCSVEHYSRFETHLACNLNPECEDKRDETEQCPFSSAECQGLVALCDHCYKFVSNLHALGEDGTDVNRRANEYCNTLGGTLRLPACLYDPHGAITDISKRYFWTHVFNAWAGLYSNDVSLPNMYRYVVHSDRFVFYHSFLNYNVNWGRLTCGILTFSTMTICQTTCVMKPALRTVGAICEVGTNKTEDIAHLPEGIPLVNGRLGLLNGQQFLTVCHDGHLTHTFLLCTSNQHKICSQEPVACYFSDQKSNTNPSRVTNAVSASTFPCIDQLSAVPYSVVCDFIADCLDHSDESFCRPAPCNNMFTCTSGQCLAFDNVCDQVSHCQDETDETHCYVTKHQFITMKRFPSPALIEFDGQKRFVVTVMNVSDPCPHSHYRCPGEFNDCLPVYTRCNGMYDCVGHHDEERCEELKCPGFLRCRFSHVCVQSEHMCDGWPHCPMHDDELWCNVPCPLGCLCQVHSVHCLQPFRADLFPHIRSVDATGSGMTLSDVSSNVYLIHLVLVKCYLTFVPNINLLNLRFLDLSGNKLEHINMTSFLGLENMLSLSLSYNPIASLSAGLSSVVQQNALTLIDISHTELTVIDPKALAPFYDLQKLNITFTSIHTISHGVFQHTPRLSELYMQGSPVKTFPPDIFAELSYLQFISAQNYKMCCKEILPHNFDSSSCHAPKDEISSCEDLLQLWIYRGFLWLITCLGVSGNVFCFCARLWARSMTSSSGFSVFVTNLTMADFLMGLYMAIIGAADERFRGRYLHHDDAWKSSVTCKVAGFLSLVSSEVSALIICLITLDRFIVLCFPFSDWRFQRTSAATVCLLVWVAGWFLAVWPLLPITSHWGFYSQTGICIPLPVTRQDFKGKLYSFGILIVLNFVLFIMISVGQAFIYWSIQKDAMEINSTKVSKDRTIARRLITIALTDFMCWFPIGLCGMLALAGVPISGEVNVALAIFVLPLNSAINPFMYTFNTLAEKRRKSKESKLLKWMESHSDLILA